MAELPPLAWIPLVGSPWLRLGDSVYIFGGGVAEIFVDVTTEDRTRFI